MSKTLVIYYSHTGMNYWNGNIVELKKGNTEIAAEYIAEAANADLFEIKPVKEYAFDYEECKTEAMEDLRKKVMPELKQYISDIAQYDTIVVAGPCWWGTFPMALASQLTRFDFAGKRVFPVMTHEGSGLGGSKMYLKNYCKNAAIGEGLAIHGAETKESKAIVAKWVQKNLE